MKRSEMIKKMTYCFNSCTKELNYNDEVAMDRVLELCEELGMLPPYNPVGSEPLEGHIMYCQWEPEDLEEE